MRKTGSWIWALGLMSGTSIDGIDAALIRTDGETIREFGPTLTRPYNTGLRASIRSALGRRKAESGLVRAITRCHAEAVDELLERHPEFCGKVSLIGFHGHTLTHLPGEGVTLQIGDGTWLARETGIDVVWDFRSDDIAAGGEGAPLAPLFHRALSGTLERPLAVLNIGGVANLTWIGEESDEDPIAFDTGPGNALLDDWISGATGEAFDRDGRYSRSGTVCADHVETVLDHDYFRRPPPKSLDRLDFDVEAVRSLSVMDGAATLAQITCRSVALGLRWLPEVPKHWLVTGGGRRNPTLMQGLKTALGVPVRPVEAVGWDGDALEAQAFAFLAVRFRRGLPTSIPSTTGVPWPVCGGRHCEAPRDRTGG